MCTESVTLNHPISMWRSDIYAIPLGTVESIPPLCFLIPKNRALKFQLFKYMNYPNRSANGWWLCGTSESWSKWRLRRDSNVIRQIWPKFVTLVVQRVVKSNKSCQLWFKIGFLLPQGRRNTAVGTAIGSPSSAVVSYMTFCDYLSCIPLNNRWREACCLSLSVSCCVCVTLGQELVAARMDKNKNKSVLRLWCGHGKVNSRGKNWEDWLYLKCAY